MNYYAFARNPKGQVAQLLVTRAPGQRMSQQWTGVVYRTEREALADMARLNCKASR